MKKKIYDCCNHMICEVDLISGMVTTKYKKQLVVFYLPVGQETLISRDNVETVLRRSENDVSVITTKQIIK